MKKKVNVQRMTHLTDTASMLEKLLQEQLEKDKQAEKNRPDRRPSGKKNQTGS